MMPKNHLNQLCKHPTICNLIQPLKKRNQQPRSASGSPYKSDEKHHQNKSVTYFCVRRHMNESAQHVFGYMLYVYGGKYR